MASTVFLTADLLKTTTAPAVPMLIFTLSPVMVAEAGPAGHLLSVVPVVAVAVPVVPVVVLPVPVVPVEMESRVAAPGRR